MQHSNKVTLGEIPKYSRRLEPLNETFERNVVVAGWKWCRGGRGWDMNWSQFGGEQNVTGQRRINVL
jgi:hypothetical protein